MFTLSVSYTVQCESLAGEKFGKFGKSSMICQTKTIQIGTSINNLLADQLIRQTFFTKSLKSKFAKLSHYTVYTMHLGYWHYFITLEFIQELSMIIGKRHNPKYGIWALALQ